MASQETGQTDKADSGGNMGMSGIAGIFTKGFDQTEGAIVDYVNMKARQKDRDKAIEEERKRMAMESEQFSAKLNQGQQQINQGNRAMNMKGLGMLEQQRINAQQRAATQSTGNFKTDFYKSLVG